MADLTTKSGALWVQPDGPNTEMIYLGCHGADEITETMGGIDLLRCFTRDGSGWNVTGQTVTPPDPVTVTLNARLKSVRSFLQTLDCAFSLYLLQRDCGYADEFNNYVRGDVLTGARITSKTKGPIASIEEDAESMLSVDVEAWPPVTEIPNLVIDALTSDALCITAAYCAVPNPDLRCYGSCGDKLAKGEQLMIAGIDNGAVRAEIEFSSDSGATLTDTVANPFAAARGALSGTRFPMGRDGWRYLVYKDFFAEQGLVSYCDDLLGTTWTPANIGVVGDQAGSTWGQALFSLHGRFILAAGANGLIHKSTDYGVTWTKVENGVIHAGDYNCVHFSDENYGFAGGAAGVNAITADGGETWLAGGIPVATEINCCWRHDKNRIWVGTTGGELWFTRNNATSWTERTGWVGSGTGAVHGMSWVNDHYGFMVHSVGGQGTVFRTINGGYDWEAITTPTNNDLYHIAAVSPSLAYAVGPSSGGLNVVLKVRESA